MPAVVKERTGPNKQIVFDGDNYSEEWHAEAEQRGLLQPAHDARRAAVAASTTRRVDGVRQVQRALRARARVALRGVRRAVRDRSSTSRPRRRPSIARTMLLPAAVAPPDASSRPAGVDDARRRDARRWSTSSSTAIHELEEANLAENRAPRTTARARGRTCATPCMPAMDDVREVADRSRGSWPTTCGRCRSTRRCCSSSDRRPEGAALAATSVAEARRARLTSSVRACHA